MVKVYIADATELKEKNLYNRLYMDLDIARRAKTDRFLFHKDKRLSVAAGALLQIALQMEHVRNPAIKVTPYGKPYLSGIDRLYFNLSHSEEMVMCAIAEKEVGCDVEKMAVLDRKLAEYVMTEYELDQIYGLKRGKEQQELFFRLWTLKESYMKATGLGFRLEPKSFSMVVQQGYLRAIPPADEQEFRFKEYFLDDGYCYSCCSLSEEFCDAMKKIELGECLDYIEKERKDETCRFC